MEISDSCARIWQLLPHIGRFGNSNCSISCKMYIICNTVCLVKQQSVQVKEMICITVWRKFCNSGKAFFSKDQCVSTDICMISKLNVNIDPWIFGVLKLQTHPVLHEYIELFLTYVLQHNTD